MTKLEDMMKDLSGQEAEAFRTLVEKEQLNFAGSGMHCAYHEVLASTGIRPDKKRVQAMELAALNAEDYHAYHGIVQVTGIKPEQADIEAYLMKVYISSLDGKHYGRVSYMIDAKLSDKQKACVEQLRRECTAYRKE